MPEDVRTMSAPTAIDEELTVAATSADLQPVRGRPFPKGQSGNPAGRPKGSRNKISELLARAVRDDFAFHGPAAIASLRERDPAAYLNMVNSMVSRDAIVAAEGKMDVVDFDGMTDAEYADAMDGAGIVSDLATDQRRFAAFEMVLSRKALSVRDAMAILGAEV